MPTILDYSVFVMPPPHGTPPSYRCPETDPGPLWTHTEEEHCKTHQHKGTHTHSINGRMDRQTESCCAENYWLQAESSHFPVTVLCPSRVANVYFGTCLLGPEEHSKKEGEDKTTLFCPTVYRSPRKM